MPGTPWFRPGRPIGSHTTRGLVAMFVVFPLLLGGGVLTFVVVWAVRHFAELTFKDWVGVVWSGLIGLGAMTTLPAVAWQEFQRRQQLRDDLRAGKVSLAEVNRRQLHGDPVRWTPGQLERWSRRRQLGQRGYIWRYGVLGFGLPAAIVWAVVMGSLYQWRPASLLAGSALVLLAGGYFFGIWTWWVREAEYQHLTRDDAAVETRDN